MIPWVREQIAEAWHSRKNSKTSERKSLTLSNSNDLSEKKNDNNIFMNDASSSDTFNVNVISLEGNVMKILVKPDFTIEKLKLIATENFYGSDSSKTSLNIRLVHAEKLKNLTDDKKLNDEDVKPKDEIMMVEIRSVDVKENFEESLRGPTLETITEATSHLPPSNPPKPTPSTDCPADFQSEIRKILITLVQASAKILMHSPEATKVYELIREKLETRCKPSNDPKTVKYLMDIGFTEKKVVKALRLKKMNASEALEWLIEHQDDPENQDDEHEFELPSIDETANITSSEPSSSSGSPTSVRRKSIKDTCIDILKGTRHEIKKEANLIDAVGLLLESFREYKRLDFRPSSRIKDSLVEMGFDEKNVIEVLKVTGNNQSNACEWLLGARRKSLQDLDEGLDPDGAIYNAVMNNPHIQLSLTNPKMLLAYLSILETPSSTSVWINDPEVSPVLSQIFKTYHSEKHAIHMNRYETTS